MSRSSQQSYKGRTIILGQNQKEEDRAGFAPHVLSCEAADVPEILVLPSEKPSEIYMPDHFCTQGRFGRQQNFYQQIANQDEKRK